MSSRTVALAIAVLATLSATACNRGEPAGPPPAMPPTPVALAVAKMAPIDDATEYVATLKSLRSTTIQPQIDGQITQIFVKSGDRVRAGRPPDADRSAAAAGGGVEPGSRARGARKRVAFARQQQQRSSELFAAGAISKQELEQAETALRTAEANLKALQAQVQQQEVQLRYYTVTAPTAGIIGDVPVRVGNQVTPQTVLTTIDQNDTLEVILRCRSSAPRR